MHAHTTKQRVAAVRTDIHAWGAAASSHPPLLSFPLSPSPSFFQPSQATLAFRQSKARGTPSAASKWVPPTLAHGPPASHTLYTLPAPLPPAPAGDTYPDTPFFGDDGLGGQPLPPPQRHAAAHHHELEAPLLSPYTAADAWRPAYPPADLPQLVMRPPALPTPLSFQAPAPTTARPPYSLDSDVFRLLLLRQQQEREQLASAAQPLPPTWGYPTPAPFPVRWCGCRSVSFFFYHAIESCHSLQACVTRPPTRRPTFLAPPCRTRRHLRLRPRPHARPRSPHTHMPCGTWGACRRCYLHHRHRRRRRWWCCLSRRCRS
jgi:hypothetical protein